MIEPRARTTKTLADCMSESREKARQVNRSIAVGELPGEILSFAGTIARAGGRALLVGGNVRDLLLGVSSKDHDIEVHGLSIDELTGVLAAFGEVIEVGRAFGVLRVKGRDIDFSIPRRDSRIGRGHTGFRVDFDPTMSFADAARRRDLTMNSIGLDPLTGEILDPFDGIGDLERGVLRATDRGTFCEDPLRALRVAQFCARLESDPDDELLQLCSVQDLDELPAERIQGELAKLLLKARRPSLGFAFLEETGLLRFFPELAALVGVPQDPQWHPEGTVWVHTLLVVDEAAALRSGDTDDDLVLMWAALCHDLGKAVTTVRGEDGRIRSPRHEPEGVPLSEALLGRLRLPQTLIDRVAVLVRYHLAPAHFVSQEAREPGYRRLARRLAEVGLSLTLLERLARSDHFGRTTPDALAREFPAGERFLEVARTIAVEQNPVADVVMGRHLLARGFEAGPLIGEILRKCRDIQDETGISDADTILDRALSLP